MEKGGDQVTTNLYSWMISMQRKLDTMVAGCAPFVSIRVRSKKHIALPLSLMHEKYISIMTVPASKSSAAKGPL